MNASMTHFCTGFEHSEVVENKQETKHFYTAFFGRSPPVFYHAALEYCKTGCKNVRPCSSNSERLSIWAELIMFLLNGLNIFLNESFRVLASLVCFIGR